MGSDTRIYFDSTCTVELTDTARAVITAVEGALPPVRGQRATFRAAQRLRLLEALLPQVQGATVADKPLMVSLGSRAFKAGDSRRADYCSKRGLTQLLNDLDRADFIRVSKGGQTPQENFPTAITCEGRLRQLFPIVHALPTPGPLTTYKPIREFKGEIPDVIPPSHAVAERILSEHAEMMKQHQVFSKEGIQLNTHLNTIWHFDSDGFTHGRIYNTGFLGYGNLSKPARKQITIDGEKVDEPDYPSHHLTLIYLIEGCVPTCKSMYEPAIKLLNTPTDKIAAIKSIIKELSLVMLNSKNTNSAIWRVKTDNEADRDCSDGEKREDAWAIYNAMRTMNISFRDVADAIICSHPKEVSAWFGTDAGRWLMSFDPLIISRVIRRLTERNIPCLPLHDSIICRHSDTAIVDKIMTEELTFFRDVCQRLYVILKEFQNPKIRSTHND